MEHLTPEEIEEYLLAFKSSDLNENGHLSTKEIKHVMRAMGLNPTEELVQEIINQHDYDGDGTLSFREFVDMMIKLRKPEEADDLDVAFKVFDTERKGFIESKDIKRCLRALRDVPSWEVEDIILEAKLQEDRPIYFSEFSKLLLPFINRDDEKTAVE